MTPPVYDPALSPLPPAWKVQVLSQMFPGGRRCSRFPVTSPRAGQSLLTFTESFRFNQTEINCVFTWDRSLVLIRVRPVSSLLLLLSALRPLMLFRPLLVEVGYFRHAARLTCFSNSLQKLQKCLSMSDAFWGISRLYFHCETIGFNLSVRPKHCWSFCTTYWLIGIRLSLSRLQPPITAIIAHSYH